MYYLTTLKDGHVKASYKDIEDVPINGFHVTHVPNGIWIDAKDVQTNPPRLMYQDVLRQKYEGMLAFDPYFDSIIYDDTSDASAYVTNPLRGALGTKRMFLNPSNGLIQTQALDLEGPFDTFKLYWDVYVISRGQQDDGFQCLYYERKNPDTLKVSISNDNGSTYKEVMFLERVLMPQSGNTLIIRFENTDPDTRYYLDGFAVLF